MATQPSHESDIYALVVGKVIATLREQHHWSQMDLAQRAHLTQSTLSRIERGQVLPDVYTFRCLAWAFNLSPMALQDQVDRSFARTREEMKAKARKPKDTPPGTPWWQEALGIAGVVGLLGLITFAVAAVIDEEQDAPDPGDED